MLSLAPRSSRATPLPAPLSSFTREGFLSSRKGKSSLLNTALPESGPLSARSFTPLISVFGLADLPFPPPLPVVYSASRGRIFPGSNLRWWLSCRSWFLFSQDFRQRSGVNACNSRHAVNISRYSWIVQSERKLLGILDSSLSR